jgi:hypothetical protein
LKKKHVLQKYSCCLKRSCGLLKCSSAEKKTKNYGLSLRSFSAESLMKRKTTLRLNYYSSKTRKRPWSLKYSSKKMTSSLMQNSNSSKTKTNCGLQRSILRYLLRASAQRQERRIRVRLRGELRV